MGAAGGSTRCPPPGVGRSRPLWRRVPDDVIIAAVDYSEARATFFTPREGPTRPLDWSSPARRLRDAMEPIATVCFWSEPAFDAYAARGLDFLQGYVWGRASVLGEPEPSVVAAAFGVFEPGIVADLYRAGRQACALSEVRRAKLEGVVAALRAVLGDPADAGGLAGLVAALRDAAAAAPLLGRPMFAGWTAVPWPEDGWAQLWQACSLLRELRGDCHLAALGSAGLDGVQANVLTELWVGWEPLAYTASRAWAPEAMAAATSSLEKRGLIAGGSLTDQGRRLREQIESATDLAVAPVIGALGAGVDQVADHLEGWAQQIIDHGWFSPDPYKRASG